MTAAASGVDPAHGERVAVAMANAVAHRGPDDHGTWSDPAAGIFLAHRRLSVLDLSAAGHQPMLAASGRYAIVYNGEIYNHLELRAELAGTAWRGHSDTETLLAGFDAWGVEATLSRAVGMFAIALWDRDERVLYLARDRLGEKPLYYGWQGDTLLFGSEMKALKAHPAFRGVIDRSALTLFVRYGYVPALYTIYCDIGKLAPGTYVALRADRREAVVTEYWSARAAAERGIRESFAGDEADARQELERLLKRSIAGQMLADVPLGAFLSGGVDSSTVVALMQAQSSRPIKTFTIGFDEDGYDEARDAKAVAEHIGTDHTELYVTPEQAMAVIPKLPWFYDEPFADSSQIPTLLVSELARKEVTVSLSGDGGDELFGGYNRYLWAGGMWATIGKVPRPLRKLFAAAAAGRSPESWDKMFRWLGPVVPRALRHRQAGDKLAKLADVVALQTPEDVYRRLTSQWQAPLDVVRDGFEAPTAADDARYREICGDLASRMMLLDTVSYLPDDILVKVDRAAMSVSLETRVPMLDHRVVEFAWTLPRSLKMRDGTGKWLLRRVLDDYVPRALVERPKSGFALPLDRWLRGPLRDWAEGLLNETRLSREGFLEPKVVRDVWREHLSGRRNRASAIWNVLMFQSWLEVAECVESRSAAAAALTDA